MIKINEIRYILLIFFLLKLHVGFKIFKLINDKSWYTKQLYPFVQLPANGSAHHGNLRWDTPTTAV